MHQPLVPRPVRRMSASGERAPLATLATANEPASEVSEKSGRAFWRARASSTLRARATAPQSFIIPTPHELHTTFPRATRELRARLNIDITLNMPSPRALAPQKSTAQTVGESLLAICNPMGAPAEVLVIALAMLQLDVSSGGVAHPIGPWVERVRADSSSYEAGEPWVTPAEWRLGNATWIVAQLNEALSKTSNEYMNAIAAAFYTLGIEYGGGVTFMPTKKMLTTYFEKLRRGVLKGIGADPCPSRAPKRSMYLAPRVARLLDAHSAVLRAELERGVDETLTIGDGRAPGSAKKTELKAQLAQTQLEQRELIEELQNNDAEREKLKRRVERDAERRDDIVRARVAGRAETIARRANARADRESERARAEVDDEMTMLRTELESALAELHTATATVVGLRASADEKSTEIEQLERAAERAAARFNKGRVRELEVVRGEPNGVCVSLTLTLTPKVGPAHDIPLEPP